MNAVNIEEGPSAFSTPTLAILQITRFGDLIQTLQAVQTLKSTHPHYRVILIARAQFSTPLNFILKKFFDKIYALDTHSLFPDNPALGLDASRSSLEHFLQDLKNEQIKVLINLSFSKSSSYLAASIAAEHRIGSFINLSGNVQINDKWSQVLYSSVMRGPLNPYSLVDLFKNIIGIKDEEFSPVFKQNFSRGHGVVFHPFASSDRKSWKAEKWVEIIYKTLKDNEKSEVFIVGSKDEFLKSVGIVENPLLKNFSTRITNLTGRTSLEELVKVLSSARLFVGHDSMVGHLAALSQTPSLTISLGNVRAHETTPYQPNAYNITPRTKCFPCFPTDPCSYTQCHHDIPYQAVGNLIKQLFSGAPIDQESIKKNNSSFHLNSINLYRSVFKNGCLVLENMIETPLDTNDIFRTFYRIAWSFVLNDSEEHFPFPKLTPNSHKDLLDSLIGVQHLFELSEFGKKYSKYILEEISSSTPSIAKIKEFSKKIDEIDHLQSMVQKTSPYLAPIIDYFIVRKGNLNGDNIVKLTESSYYCFEENAHVCSVMYELIQNTIAEHKLIPSKRPTPSSTTSR